MNRLINQQVLIYGGNFNPPTLAHQAIISACLKLPGFSEIWAMPSGERTDKHHDSDSQTRLEMLKLVKHQVFKNNPRLRITDFELRLPTPTQTSRTIGALICQYPSVDFWYVFGVDSYNSMPTWEDGDRLQAELNMVIIKRGDGKLPERNGIRTIETKASSDISSTAVRESAKAGRSLDGLVSPAIKRYIEKHRLYL